MFSSYFPKRDAPVPDGISEHAAFLENEDDENDRDDEEQGHCGPKVKALVEKAQLLEHLKEVGNSRAQYILFSRYMEALVAYRKFYGGHDE